jgi:methyl-accepting chemotaxis protein
MAPTEEAIAMESTKAAPSKTPRRQYLVDRDFQLKYTLLLAVVGAAISVLFGAMMYQAHVETTELMGLPNPYQAIVEGQDRIMLWLVMAIAVGMAIALAMSGILITHRIAGPIFVFSRYMSVLAQGRYPLLRPLRKKDELKSFYESFNQAVASMRERDKSSGEELKEIATVLEAAAAEAPRMGEALKSSMEKLRSMSKRLLEAAASADPATPGQKAEAAGAKIAAA